MHAPLNTSQKTMNIELHCFMKRTKKSLIGVLSFYTNRNTAHEKGKSLNKSTDAYSKILMSKLKMSLTYAVLLERNFIKRNLIIKDYFKNSMNASLILKVTVRQSIIVAKSIVIHVVLLSNIAINGLEPRTINFNA